ncbi:MAG: type IV pilus modification protein PilV [Betaproteobacteria bacterium]|nr:type IV pilus modification protein PilV [Betaproteobacteria bacterium]
MMRPSITSRHSGFTLIEVMVALVIFSFGLLGLVGLQGAMIKNATDAKYRSDAADLTDQIVGTIWADRGNIAQYAYNSSSTQPTCVTGSSIASGCSGSSSATCNVENWLCEVQDSVQGPPSKQTISITGEQVKVTVQWPASTPSSGTTSYHSFTETADVGG